MAAESNMLIVEDQYGNQWNVNQKDLAPYLERGGKVVGGVETKPGAQAETKAAEPEPDAEEAEEEAAQGTTSSTRRRRST